MADCRPTIHGSDARSLDTLPPQDEARRNGMLWQARNVTKEVPAAVGYDGPLTVTVSPNPTASVFTLVIRTRKTLPVSVRLVDESGRSVETKENAPVGTAFTMGAKLITGIYFAETFFVTER